MQLRTNKVRGENFNLSSVKNNVIHPETSAYNTSMNVKKHCIMQAKDLN